MKPNKVSLVVTCSECGGMVPTAEGDGEYYVPTRAHSCLDSPYPPGAAPNHKTTVVHTADDGGVYMNTEDFDFEITPVENGGAP